MKHHLIITVKVEPRSSRSQIVGMYGDALKVKLISPPTEGKANEELIDLLSRAYTISRKDVKILSGFSSKIKRIKLYGVNTIDDWRKADSL